MMRQLVLAALIVCIHAISRSDLALRRVRISNQEFVLVATNEPIVMIGPNVVVKGPPFLPSVQGSSPCPTHDLVNDTCASTGTCSTCSTFNQGDIAHIKSMGWNTIRLGVVWAGAQPRDENALDPDFVKRLHAILNLTDATGIHVMLDNHGDMVGSAGCGNGVPMWFQKKAAPELIGKQLETGFPYKIISKIDVKKVGGYEKCGDDATKWAAYAGDPNYNLLNECCQAMNGGNPAGLGYTTISQKTMDYVIDEGPGRDDFVRFWTLMAKEIVSHPSAFAVELMNEPMTIKRPVMFEAWVAVAKAVNAIIPDLSVSLADVGEGAVFPWWVTKFGGSAVTIGPQTLAWIKSSGTVFFAWHWYGDPKDPEDAVKNVQEIGSDWNVPTFLTETMSCGAWKAALAANISVSYWHYSAYCNTGPQFGDRKVPSETFGACILGWGAGDTVKTCD